MINALVTLAMATILSPAPTDDDDLVRAEGLVRRRLSGCADGSASKTGTAATAG
ncbi:MAG: hypothetical protein U1E76_04770 [Planctomycetota bacterium]